MMLRRHDHPRRFEEIDPNCSIRPTIIGLGSTGWRKSAYKSLLSTEPKVSILNEEGQVILIQFIFISIVIFYDHPDLVSICSVLFYTALHCAVPQCSFGTDRILFRFL